MVSSAVAVPEEPPEAPNEQHLSPLLKRRQSSLSPSDSNKRPRLETSGANGSTDHASRPHSATATSPPRRKSTLDSTGAEEKKRGQRLFGGLLNTLSQTSSRPSNKRRDEIEQRQRDRLKREVQDRAEQRRQKREELDRIRRSEQKRWHEESVKVKHRNMRATAGFLQTRTEPRLYYKPWELRKDEEQTIERQKEEAEDTIKRETEKEQAQAHTTNGINKVEEENEPVNGSNATERVEPQQSDNAMQVGDEKANGYSATSGTNAGLGTAADISPVPDESIEDKQKDDDHGADDQEEGHDEDQVIY